MSSKFEILFLYRTHIKFVFLRSGKSRLLVPKENQGVGVVGGRDDLAILAWSDIGEL